MVPLLTLATVIVGLLWLLPLLVLSRKRPATLWLGLFVYAITSLALADYCQMTGLYQRYPQLLGLFDWPVAALGACFYCYVRSLTGLSNGWRQSVHFVPVLVLIAMLVNTRLGLPSAELAALLQSPPPQRDSPVLLLLQLLTAGYALAVWYRLWLYRIRLRQQYASTRQRDLVWLQWLTLAVVALLILWFPAVQAGGAWLHALVIGRLVLLYAFGWYGLRQQQVFLAPLEATPAQIEFPQQLQNPIPASTTVVIAAEPTQTAAVAAAQTTSPELPAPQLSAPQPPAPQSAKYSKSGMTPAAAQLIGERLTRRMQQQQDYLDNDLTLTDLAQRIGTSPQLLSEYLNVALQQNFFDYINSQRVAAVQRQLSSATASTVILDLALAAGFNSKSTFNTAFRKHSGMTPSAWRVLHQRQNGSEPIGSDD